MVSYKKIIDYCKQELGDRVLHTYIEDHEHGKTLSIGIDASREEDNYSLYPSLENGTIKVYESVSNGLNVFIYPNHKVRFYYQGQVELTTDNRKYIEYIDGDGYEYTDERVFEFEFRQPEEIVEWVRFILRFNHEGASDEIIDIRREELPAANWFEAPKVFLPSFSEKLVALNDLQKVFNVHDLPALYDKTYHIGTLDASEMNTNDDAFLQKLRAMNAEGAREMEAVKERYAALSANSTDTLQPGDLLFLIGNDGFVMPYFNYSKDGNDKTFYYIVLRPKSGASFAALLDFFKHEEESRDFMANMLDASTPFPETLRFIPDFKSQQHYMLQKRSGVERISVLFSMLKRRSSKSGDVLDQINAAVGALEKLNVMSSFVGR
jgi:hypothetical protein